MAPMFEAGLAPLNAARTKLGLESVRNVIEQLNRPGLHLVASAEAFDFPASEQPANLHYVGPLLDPPDWAEPRQHQWPAPSRPLVLVAFSTTHQNQASVLRNIVQALSQLPVNAVLTSGPACEAMQLNAPANVLVVPSGCHDAILSEADLCVTHCGHGTVMRALSAGVPILAMPMGRDQNDNAARVAWHRAGIRIAPDNDPEVIASAAARLIHEPAFVEAARSLGAKIRAETMPDRAARLLEKLAEDSPSTSEKARAGAAPLQGLI
jgi:MGT family glycosyltransferase